MFAKSVAESRADETARPEAPADDRAERVLLTRHYVRDAVVPDAAFARRTLDALRRAQTDSASVRAFADDRPEAHLLRAHFIPADDQPCSAFAEQMRTAMRQRLAAVQTAAPAETASVVSEAAASGTTPGGDEERLSMLFKHGYRAVDAAPDFRRHLYMALRRRQRDLVFARRLARRRGLSGFGLGALASAAALLLLGVVPALTDSVPVSGNPVTVAHPVIDFSTSDSGAAGGAPVLLAKRSVDPVAVLAAVAWPSARTGEMVAVTGLEYRAAPDAPWERLERGMARLDNGASFRSDEYEEQVPGFVFENGTQVALLPGSRLEVEAGGLRLTRGTATTMVPKEAGALALCADERDLSIEPGSMALLRVADPDQYAPGGAPAPMLKVADGGLALARSHAGVGALFPGQAYRIDRYVTADIPGRPLFARETGEIVAPLPADPRGSGMLLASAASRDRAEMAQARTLGYNWSNQRWVDPGYREGAPLRRIGYLSPEYIELARARRDLAAPLALGSGVIFRDGENSFIEID